MKETKVELIKRVCAEMWGITSDFGGKGQRKHSIRKGSKLGIKKAPPRKFNKPKKIEAM